MAKIQNSSDAITPFGGLFVIDNAFSSINLAKFIDNHLGVRKHSSYQYSDGLLSMFYNTLAGGNCTEDIAQHLGPHISQIPDLKVPSPDTILNMQQSLATEKRRLISQNNIINEIVINDKLNKLNIGLCKRLGLIGEDQDVTLDFDHQLIACEKQDATYNYKGKRGYFPGVATINNLPVYIEGRNGNCSVKFNQLDTLQRAFDLLEQKGISPKRYRADSGSYITDVCDFLQTNDKRFYIRAKQSDHLLLKASGQEDWQRIKIGEIEYETCSLEHSFGNYSHRVVCYRWPNKNGQTQTMTGDANNYLFIITNDWHWSDKDIIKYYNDRGASEKTFDVMNNDFNWDAMPFSELQYNTVYLILMAMCRNLYQWLIERLSNGYEFLAPTFRLKKFIFRFVTVAAKWIRRGGQKVLKLFTHKEYWFMKNIDSS